MGSKNVNYKCILKYDPCDNENCMSGKACATCGWNVDVNNLRTHDIDKNGLTLCSDGLRRYILP